MILVPLTPDLKVQLESWGRKLHLGNLIKSGLTCSDLITIGDGTPDDVVLLLLARARDGKKPVYVVKPREKRYGALMLIDTYLKNKNLKRVLFLMDQEKDDLKSVYKSIEDSLNEKGVKAIDIEIKKADLANRLYVWQCSKGDKEF